MYFYTPSTRSPMQMHLPRLVTPTRVLNQKRLYEYFVTSALWIVIPIISVRNDRCSKSHGGKPYSEKRRQQLGRSYLSSRDVASLYPLKMLGVISSAFPYRSHQFDAGSVHTRISNMNTICHSRRNIICLMLCVGCGLG